MAEVDDSIRTYRSAGMQPGTSYDFRVQAVDGTGSESHNGLMAVGLTRSDADVPNNEVMRLALASDCAGCHNSWFMTNESFESSVIQGQSGDFANSGVSLARPFIVPGDPEGSLLIEFMEARCA